MYGGRSHDLKMVELISNPAVMVTEGIHGRGGEEVVSYETGHIEDFLHESDHLEDVVFDAEDAQRLNTWMEEVAMDLRNMLSKSEGAVPTSDTSMLFDSGDEEWMLASTKIQPDVASTEVGKPIPSITLENGESTEDVKEIPIITIENGTELTPVG